LRQDAKPEPAGEPLGRLTRRAEFLRVARGRRSPTPTFTLQSRRREEADREAMRGARLGLTVAKSVGGAVERNRVRRRLKAALRAAAPLEAESDHDYVLVARREALGSRFAALVDDVRHAFRAARRDKAERRGRASALSAAKDEDRRP
jgi:ribonuclease P protein component